MGSLFGDIESRRLLIAKGFLFVLCGSIACAIVLLEAPTWRAALGLALAIWAFCRAYYFAFYVIERYMDPSFRFAGIWSAIGYLLKTKRAKQMRP